MEVFLPLQLGKNTHSLRERLVGGRNKNLTRNSENKIVLWFSLTQVKKSGFGTIDGDSKADTQHIRRN